ncbi:MAG: NYN domain-containing protein, partial [Candidatus Aenigmarchaeota archaeon]|nr:NYN domain-containing protein [Candidatus Aenigmarchaeota archaeon]
FVDGPNMLRKEFDTDLDNIRKKLEEHGRVAQSIVFLNQYAPDKLIEAVTNQGFHPVIGMGGTKNDQTDVDVYMAVEAIEAIHNKNIDMIAIATRDADFLPVVQTVKKHGKKIIVIGQNPGFSKGLQRAADIVIDITKPQTNRYARNNNYNRSRNTYPKNDTTNTNNSNNNKSNNDASK